MDTENYKIDLERVENIINQNAEPDWLKQRRIFALHYLNDKLMPKTKYGLNISLDISGFEFSKVNIQGINEGTTRILSKPEQKEIIFTDLNTAIKEHEELVKPYLLNKLNPEKLDKYKLFNHALFNQGQFIYIPKGVEAKIPLTSNLTNTGTTKSTINQTLIVAEEQSKINFFENISPTNNPYYFGDQTIIIVKQGANVTYGSVQNLPLQTWNFSNKTGYVEKDGILNWVTSDIRSKFSKIELNTELNGSGATTNKVSMFYGIENQIFDIYLKAKHNAPHTNCNMFTKGALDDQGKSFYRGLIKMGDNTLKAVGRQKEDTLLLSKQAQANAIPYLEIENTNDVQCSHGATIGQIDKDKLFYLQTRGISEKESRKKIVEGFFNPIIQMIPNKEIQDQTEKVIGERLK